MSRMRTMMVGLTALLVPVAALHAGGETITVTTLNDVSDFSGAQVADLPGPDGVVSFREACAAANNTAGPQTIAFAIPQSEWWLISNMALLRLEDGIFALNDDGTTVDFTTQTEFTGVLPRLGEGEHSGRSGGSYTNMTARRSRSLRIAEFPHDRRHARRLGHV